MRVVRGHLDCHAPSADVPGSYRSVWCPGGALGIFHCGGNGSFLRGSTTADLWCYRFVLLKSQLATSILIPGPITVFNKVIFQIFQGRQNFQYLQFMGWVYLWGAILHFIAAFSNGASSCPISCVPASLTNSRCWSEMGHSVLVRYIWVLRCSRVRAVRYSGRYQAIRAILRSSRVSWYLVS
jgi:hypothetical protein